MDALLLYVSAVLLGGLAHAQLESSAKRLGLGDSCRLKDGLAGTCTKLEECPAAIEDIRKGKLPTTCFFDKISPITCCPMDGQPNTRRTSVKHQLPSKPGPRLIRSTSTSSEKQSSVDDCLDPVQDWVPTPEEKKFLKELAEQKCIEYQQYAYQQQQIPTTNTTYEDNLHSNQATCPLRRVRRIVGGVPAAPQEFPHMAVIGYGERKENNWRCGGSLISRRHIITTASCAKSVLGCARWVLLGALLLNDTSFNSQPQEFEIVRRIRHPNFMPPQRYNDIAIFELDRDVNITAYVRPACLYTQFAPPENGKGIAIGFGRQNWLSSEGSNALLKVTLPFLTYNHCNITYKISFRLPYGIYDHGMLCAGDLSGNKDTCQGDAGGPFQVQDFDNCMYKIIGITSFGSTVCGAKDAPAVYTRVSSYVPWIAKTIWT